MDGFVVLFQDVPLLVAVGSMTTIGCTVTCMLLPRPDACTMVTPAKPTTVYCVLAPLPVQEEKSGTIRGWPIMSCKSLCKVLFKPGPPAIVSGELGVAWRPLEPK